MFLLKKLSVLRGNARQVFGKVLTFLGLLFMLFSHFLGISISLDAYFVLLFFAFCRYLISQKPKTQRIISKKIEVTPKKVIKKPTNLKNLVAVSIFGACFLVLFFYANFSKRSKQIVYNVPDFVVLLDCGHGGLDSFGVYQTQYAKQHKHESGSFHSGTTFYEGVFNRSLGKRIAEKLADLGIQYQFINHEYLDMSNEDRVLKANEISQKNHCLLISLHANASDNKDAKGLSVFVGKNASPQSKELANDLGIFLGNVEGTFLRKNNPKEMFWLGDFMILREVKCDAVLSENCFFTSKEAELMLTEEFQEQVANAHVKMIVEYLKKNFKLKM